MKKMLPVLLAALVGLAGCSKKEDATPAAKQTQTGLEGRWAGVSTRAVATATNGSVVSDVTTPFASGAYAVEFTATELIVYSGTAVDKRNTYTRSGNIITLSGTPPSSVTVQEQTASRLVLISEPTTSGGNVSVRTTTYSR